MGRPNIVSSSDRTLSKNVLFVYHVRATRAPVGRARRQRQRSGVRYQNLPCLALTHVCACVLTLDTPPLAASTHPLLGFLTRLVLWQTCSLRHRTHSLIHCALLSAKRGRFASCVTDVHIVSCPRRRMMHVVCQPRQLFSEGGLSKRAVIATWLLQAGLPMCELRGFPSSHDMATTHA